ncbi:MULTISPECIES: efflux RND transporter periplasmic adaptor subunit [unclassified Pseudomonas]|jgi:multidrug resistance efflux pump|uniref:efflux RND transporter periplasmic adaptor subunit n=1 Tax=unclassified Pseudomonas TaxID=196821 RepID=UPI0008BA0F29|nr:MULTISPECIES: HlyD family secretion protein [unclassified Pseudomonas]PMV17541.1 HlyD family secretion protein [Pseudomonas sp. FW305-3-2-15-C-TSA2]PMV18076.1 HlyD family secretion protein [Pseudomonas sp. DP16D-L5]PMV36736.1 HlyD family secretion protein [Pseudomonas sp. FW305-3-2-15-A-LB2]PMV42728.1 HlyD family secretion protein [Pseudomonas sp. FW305-3-2-15-C-R2A1]PMV49216.1 HlyD family secretion protein [Pseudomonas sp. FW305-3-2-15-C-LB1]
MTLNKLFKMAVTLGLGLVALLFCMQLWRAYVLAPWTRDGRVSAQVIHIAPEVSGQVERLLVGDNQWVAKGALLYEIDQRAYQIAQQQRMAELAEARSIFEQRTAQFRRRSQLGDAIAREETDNAAQQLAVAKARLDAARSQLAQAQLDLGRTAVRSPVEGYVTQLRLQPGDYAVAGSTNIYVVDSQSFWVTAYFEETKLPGVLLGAPASIKLMGFAPLLQGHVASIGRGIADTNELRGDSGLPQVAPTFSWIRLAQRVPVRIELDSVPQGVELAAGMTASIEVGQANADARWRLTRWLQAFM